MSKSYIMTSLAICLAISSAIIIKMGIGDSNAREMSTTSRSSLHKFFTSPIYPPFENHLKMVMFGMGCFWGAEKVFWQIPGVQSTHVGYAGGHTLNPTYKQVCSGRTGHNEVVRVVYDPSQVSFAALLKAF